MTAQLKATGQDQGNETLAPAPAGLVVRTQIKAGGTLPQHNETLASVRAGLVVRTQLKAGQTLSHGETLAAARPAGLVVRTQFKAGSHELNHIETIGTARYA